MTKILNTNIDILGTLNLPSLTNGIQDILTISNIGNVTYRTPSEILSDIGVAGNYQPLSEKGQANGYASLDSSGNIPQSQLPAVSITETFVVSSQVNMLALAAQTGDVAIRTDENRSYILQGTDPTILVNWQELLSPSGGVSSVNGLLGDVILDLSFTSGMLGITGGNTVNLDSRYVNVDGDTMTGNLTVTGTISGSNLSGTNTGDQTLSGLGGEPAFSKNTAFNKNFGTSSGTVAQGNHTHTFASIDSKPTSLSGYGITDAYTKSETLQYFLRKDVNDTFSGQFLTLNNTANHGIVTGSDSQRLLIGGGSSWNGANGAYISIEGNDYGGTNAGGNIHLLPASGGVVNSATGLKISSASGAITNSNNNIMLRSNGSATVLSSANDAVYIRPVSDSSTTGQLVVNTSGSVVTSNNLTVNGSLNATANVNAKILIPDGGGGNGVRTYGTSTGIANIAYNSFYESNGTVRQGYVGFPSSSHSSMFMRNDVFDSDIRLDSGGVNGLKFYDGGATRTVYHSGNLRSNSQNDSRYFPKDISVPGLIANDFTTDGYVNARPWNENAPPISHGTTFGFGEGASGFRQIHMSDAGDVAVRALNYNNTAWSPWRTLWHDGNLRSNTENDARYYTKGQSDNNYIKRNNRTDGGYAWIRRDSGSSTSSPFYVTEQGAGVIAAFYQGSGDGSRKSEISNDGGYRMMGGGNIDIYNGGAIRRFSHSSGYLEGSYNTVGANAANTNPIYIIGSAYKPTDTTLNNMYGIGYSQGGSASFINSTQLGTNPSNGWGMYLAAAGNARIFLDASNGNGYFRGGIYADRGVFRGTVTGSNLSGTNTGDQTLSGLGGVPTSRTISTGSGLSGGGNLSSNRTLSVDSTVARTNVAETFSSTVRATNFILSSDRRLKENIESLGNGYYTFNFIDDETKRKRYGAMADEVKEYAPELIYENEEGYDQVGYIDFLIKKIAELEERLNKIEI